MTTTIAVHPAMPNGPLARSRKLLAAAFVAGPLFTVVYLAEGAFRGHGYSPFRHPVSSLALGPRGWEQVLNFVVCGLLTVLFSIGLRRTLRSGPGALALPLLVAVWGAGLIGAGIFETDPIGGYPTTASPVTLHGQLHDLAFSLPAFTALAFAMLTAGVAFGRRRLRTFALYSALSSIAFIACFVLATLGFSGTEPWVSTAGLWQRLRLSVGWLWLGLLAANGFRVAR